ncbi:GDSL lipase/acylhydrolase family protein [Clavulina sp. PMI_390]|nr:GDSL lipase/acylhydrolase family protein [Clavulina sp. PMI_390]
MKVFLALNLALLSLSCQAATRSNGFPFKSLVSFGDSYTDEGRLAYLQAHNGSMPPTHTFLPPSNNNADGGYIWGRFVANATGMNLYDYAVSGAACSNLLTGRYSAKIPGGGFFPSVQEEEIPAFLADWQYNSSSHGHTDSKLALDPDTTVYSIWIGTNDLGRGSLITDEGAPGVSLTNVSDCVVNAMVKLYEAGARYIVFQNLVPLYLTPLYATPENGGVRTYLDGNLTAISEKMRTLTLGVNQIWKYQVPAVAATLKDAKISLFDSFGLIMDIRNNPTQYLSPPYNITGYLNHCTVADNCTTSWNYDPDHPDGYLWYDELHPSQKTESIVAKEFVKAMQKQSKYATYFY